MTGESEGFHRIARRLQGARENEFHAQLIVDTLDEIGFENVAVLQAEKRTGRLSPLALSRSAPGAELHDEIEFVRARATRLGQGITGRTARSGESIRVGDVRRDPHYHPMREEIRSELCVPLKLDDRWRGVLNVESPSANLYSQGDQRFLEAVGTHIALAIMHDELTALTLPSGPPAESELVPICASCKKMRDSDHTWCRFEEYLHDHAGLTFTHGICPDCRVAY